MKEDARLIFQWACPSWAVSLGNRRCGVSASSSKLLRCRNSDPGLPANMGTAFCGAVLCPPASLGVLTVLVQRARPQSSPIPGRAARIGLLVNQRARCCLGRATSLLGVQTAHSPAPRAPSGPQEPVRAPPTHLDQITSRKGGDTTCPSRPDGGLARWPAPAAPPPTSGRTAVTCPGRSGRRGCSRVEYPVFPSAGSGATFPFRLRVPERRGRPDRGAERRRGR